MKNVIISVLPMKKQDSEELNNLSNVTKPVAKLLEKFSSFDSHSCFLMRLVVQQLCPIELSAMTAMFPVCTV